MVKQLQQKLKTDMLPSTEHGNPEILLILIFQWRSD